MTVYTPLWLGPKPGDTEGPEYAAREDRQILATLFSEGVGNVQAGHLAVAQRAAGANMTVEVAPGTCYITGDDVARQGMYRTDVTAVESVTIAAPPASGSRIDLIVARVYDAQEIGGTKHGLVIEPVPGTAAASPSAPSVPSTAIPLAQVLVAAGATSIQASAITDRRAQSGANSIKVATSVQPMTTAQRDALSGSELFDGRVIDNITLAKMQIRRSGTWGDVTPTPPQLKAQGSYSGDGSNLRYIPVGFSADLIIVGDSAGVGFGWLHRMGSFVSQSLSNSGGFFGDCAAENGFLVAGPAGSPSGVLNNSSRAYYWTAFKIV